MTGPVERSLRWYRKQGWYAYSVSRYVPQAKRTVDFANFADIIAYSPVLARIVACQATTTGNQAARVAKILALESAGAWWKAGGDIQVHGWAKKGPRGKRKVWQLTVTPVLGFLDIGPNYDFVEPASTPRPRREGAKTK